MMKLAVMLPEKVRGEKNTVWFSVKSNKEGRKRGIIKDDAKQFQQLRCTAPADGI